MAEILQPNPLFYTVGLVLSKMYTFMGIPLLLFILSYFVIYKIILNGEKCLPWKQLIAGVILISYMGIVLSATLFHRGVGTFTYSPIKFNLFASYLSAIRSPLFLEWRNLILNVFMFVPIGFLLPLTFTKLNSFWITTVISALTSLSIELMQSIFGFGLFAVDDILNNTLGGALGFLFFDIGMKFLRKNFNIKLWKAST